MTIKEVARNLFLRRYILLSMTKRPWGSSDSTDSTALVTVMLKDHLPLEAFDIRNVQVSRYSQMLKRLAFSGQHMQVLCR